MPILNSKTYLIFVLLCGCRAQTPSAHSAKSPIAECMEPAVRSNSISSKETPSRSEDWVRVEGEFSAVGVPETFLVRAGGVTTGAAGGRTAYLLRKNDEKPFRMISNFPAEACVPVTRPQRNALLVCLMANTWNGVPSYAVHVYDLSKPLEVDSNINQGVDRTGAVGWIRPVQVIVDSAADLGLRYTCASSKELAMFPMLALVPKPVGLQLLARDRVSFAIRAPAGAPTSFAKTCTAMAQRIARDALTVDAKEEPFSAADDLAVMDQAARTFGAPERLAFALLLDSGGDRMVIRDDSTLRQQASRIGFNVPSDSAVSAAVPSQAPLVRVS
jgi:hypothetical protein